MGKLVLLNSSIGDLDDLSPKVCGHLQRGRYFAVEDSRKFKDMLGRLGISLSGKVIESFHDHSGSNKLSKIISWLEDEGRDVYVASERGSPIISDPAFPLVQLALEQHKEVATVSGVCSVLYALELAGLPPTRLVFGDFCLGD